MNTMTVPIQVHVSVLKALLLHAGKVNIRYYLNGIYIEAGPVGLRAVATDGHTLAVYADSVPREECVSVIVPRDAVENILRGAAKNEVVAFAIEGGAIELSRDTLVIRAKPLHATFPDWRRVLPATCSGEPAQYNPDHLVRADKAHRLYMGARSNAWPGIAMNGNYASLVKSDENFWQVIMPLRATPPTAGPLEWFKRQQVAQPIVAEAVPA